MAEDYEVGVLVGLLVGEGHFGGDGRQPQVTLRMHVRHEAVFRWLEQHFPGGKLYGPYDHGGRHYFQWMARGAFLRDELLPILEARISPDLDAYSHARLQEMRERYADRLATSPPASPRRVRPTRRQGASSTAGAVGASGGRHGAGAVDHLDEIFKNLKRSRGG